MRVRGPIIRWQLAQLMSISRLLAVSGDAQKQSSSNQQPSALILATTGTLRAPLPGLGAAQDPSRVTEVFQQTARAGWQVFDVAPRPERLSPGRRRPAPHAAAARLA
jgi:hypothetical protein